MRGPGAILGCPAGLHAKSQFTCMSVGPRHVAVMCFMNRQRKQPLPCKMLKASKNYTRSIRQGGG